MDVHESAIVDTLRRIMDIIAPPALPEPPRKPIGFQAKERRGSRFALDRMDRHC